MRNTAGQIYAAIVTSDRSRRSSTLTDAAGEDGVAVRTGEVRLVHSWGRKTKIRKMLDEQRKVDGIREVIVTSDESSKSPTLADAASLAGLDGVAIRTGEVKLAYS